jgi:hypothetical protein
MNESIPQIAGVMGRSVETIWRNLKKSGGTRIPEEGWRIAKEAGRVGVPPINRIRFFDEAVFSRELTPSTVWLLGLLFGDGGSTALSVARWLYETSSEDIRADRKYQVFLSRKAV